VDHPDVIYKTKAAKQRAVVGDIADVNETGQPVLVGTISIEASEELSRHLKAEGVGHTVLNAKYHEQEAEIIAHAGEKGRVTIATNMAGRGTDIKLGEAVRELGGLFIMGTERHEARRIDNQLRGRSGRQGDPGASRFYLSLEDDLMRIFGGERIANLMTRLKVEEDEAITHGLITRAIENAQKRVEAHNFEIRKHVLEYDDVMNKQREVIYAQRREILGTGVDTVLLQMAEEVLEDMLATCTEHKNPEQWNLDSFRTLYHATFNAAPAADWSGGATPQDLLDPLLEQVRVLFRAKRESLRPMLTRVQGEPPGESQMDEVLQHFARHLLLSIHDAQWKDHLLSMDHLREGIGLVGYAQKKPIDEYKRAGFEMFSELMARIAKESVATFFRAQFSGVEAPEPVERKQPRLKFNQGDEDAAARKAARSRSIPNWGKKKERKRKGA
jgi:preprotein translocase subunit SecA